MAPVLHRGLVNLVSGVQHAIADSCSASRHSNDYIDKFNDLHHWAVFNPGMGRTTWRPTLGCNSMTDELVILDSWGGETLHPAYKAALPHANFNGTTPPRYKNLPAHSHGAWCAWHDLAQTDKSTDVIFLRMFDENGSSGMSEADVLALIRSVGPRPPGVRRRWNWSWGGSTNHWSPQWVDDVTEFLDGDLVCAAAGNSGKLRESYPQRNLKHLPNFIVVGAVDKYYRRASFSETGSPGGEFYVKCAARGTGLLALDGNTGRIISWQGTSGASPNALGALSANDVTGADAMRYITQWVLDDLDNDGTPNGINNDWVGRITQGEYHHEVGRGVIEGVRQIAMEATGRDLRVGSQALSGLDLEPQYHDFTKL